MKTLIVVLVLQIFIGHCMSDVIDDNRESAMNAIKECIDESKVKVQDLEYRGEDYDADQVHAFLICYNERMEEIKDLAEHCEQKGKNAAFRCYNDILVGYIKDYLK